MKAMNIKELFLGRPVPFSKLVPAEQNTAHDVAIAEAAWAAVERFAEHGLDPDYSGSAYFGTTIFTRRWFVSILDGEASLTIYDEGDRKYAMRIYAHPKEVGKELFGFDVYLDRRRCRMIGKWFDKRRYEIGRKGIDTRLP